MLGSVNVRSPGGALYRRKCVGAVHEFTMSQGKNMLDIVVSQAIKTNDLFLRIKKKTGDPSTNLDPTRQSLILRDEQEEIPIARLKPLRKKSVTPALPAPIEVFPKIQREKEKQHLRQNL